MATRIGLLRARGQSRGVQLLHGQQQLCGSTSSTSINSSVRLLARLSCSSRSAVGSTASSSSCSASASVAPSSSASSRRQQQLHLSLFSARKNSNSSCKALFSSTTRPSHAGAEDEAIEHSSKPAGLTFDGGNIDDRLARLDDGDKYPDFVDLRLAEADQLFPEGLAGGGQGALERATTRGTSTAILHREAADALIHSLDDFAEGSDGALFGIARIEKWRKNCEARQYGNPASAAAAAAGGEEDGHDDGMGGAEAAVAAVGDDAPGDGEDDIVGDVRAAAAEGAAAAEAAAKAVTAATMAAAGGGTGSTASGDEADPETEGDKKGKKEILGTGPIWEEMKALAESNRKALKGVQSVWVQPGQRSYLLTGRRGSGKSCVLNQAVLHARSTGWIVLFVPDGRNLVQKGIYCQPSPIFEGLYDLPVQSLKRLKTLRDAHGDQLKDINIKDPEVLARHEGAKTLLDVMDKGLADEELAGTAHYDVMRELLATTEAKVMLAIDEYNELFQMSHWHYGDDKLEAPHLTATLPLVPPLVSTGTGLAFADDALASVADPGAAAAAGSAASLDAQTGAACLPPPPANGIVVCAMSGRYPPVKKLRKKKWTPFEEMAGRLATAVSLPVEPYTRREFLRVLKHYARVEQVVNEPLGTMEVAKVHAKSDGLAEHVFETCRAGRYRTVVHDD